MSDLEQFQRMAAIFEAARSLHGDERASFLQTHCKGETELITRVLRLLRHHESTQGLLEAPITPPADLLIEKTHAPATVPSAIGAYRVIRLIGSGGMGAVYLAEQPNPRRMVALKVIRPGAVSADTLRRLGSEAALLGKLRHPGIAQIYESGTYHDGVGDRPYFAMEYVDGQALPDYVRARHLDTSARLELVAQLCDTVQHAHQRGVIHRDLKPANILVDASGQPKVLDFGVARSIEPDPQSLATRPGALLGTVGYMSPEQIEAGADAVDTRTDIHSLGVILYELMTGRLPYELSDTTLIGALNRIREADPTPLGRVAPS
ncbi:MAG: serine/threonine-protein kinase, partial [Phycisphaerae bacterium]